MLFEVTLFGPASSQDAAKGALSAAGFAVQSTPCPYGSDGPPPYGDGPPQPPASSLSPSYGSAPAEAAPAQAGEQSPTPLADDDLPPDPAADAAWLRADVDLLHADDPSPQDFWLRKATAAVERHGWQIRMHAVQVGG